MRRLGENFVILTIRGILDKYDWDQFCEIVKPEWVGQCVKGLKDASFTLTTAQFNMLKLRIR